MPVNAFKWKHFAGEIILLNVRWYLKYALSYKNLEEIMAERGIKVVPLQKIMILKQKFSFTAKNTKNRIFLR